jgi:hypothetical protein
MDVQILPSPLPHSHILLPSHIAQSLLSHSLPLLLTLHPQLITVSYNGDTTSTSHALLSSRLLSHAIKTTIRLENQLIALKVTLQVPEHAYEVLERNGDWVEKDYLRQNRAIALGKVAINVGGETAWVDAQCGK